MTIPSMLRCPERIDLRQAGKMTLEAQCFLDKGHYGPHELEPGTLDAPHASAPALCRNCSKPEGEHTRTIDRKWCPPPATQGFYEPLSASAPARAPATKHAVGCAEERGVSCNCGATNAYLARVDHMRAADARAPDENCGSCGHVWREHGRSTGCLVWACDCPCTPPADADSLATRGARTPADARAPESLDDATIALWERDHEHSMAMERRVLPVMEEHAAYVHREQVDVRYPAALREVRRLRGLADCYAETADHYHERWVACYDHGEAPSDPARTMRRCHVWAHLHAAIDALAARAPTVTEAEVRAIGTAAAKHDDDALRAIAYRLHPGDPAATAEPPAEALGAMEVTAYTRTLERENANLRDDLAALRADRDRLLMELGRMVDPRFTVSEPVDVRDVLDAAARQASTPERATQTEGADVYDGDVGLV